MRNKTSKKKFETDQKLLYLAVLIIFSNWVILNTEPELSMEDNLKFHEKTNQSFIEVNDKIDLLTAKIDSLKTYQNETK